MAVTYYGILFVLSLLLTTIYIFIWHKHLDVTFAMVYAIISIACMGYLMYSTSESLGAAVLAQKIVYIGACFLQYFVMLSVFHLCKINVKKWIVVTLFICCLVLYASVLTIGYKPYFYKSISFEFVDGLPYLNREYGFMHIFSVIFICAFCIVGIATILNSYFKKKQVAGRILVLLFLPDMISVLSYFIGHEITKSIDFIPIGYVFAEFIYLCIAHRISLYDIDDTVVDSVVQDSDNGFISFDFRYRYLGSNETAKRIFPVLKDLPIDTVVDKKDRIDKRLLHWIKSFAESENNNVFLYTLKTHGKDGDDERIYNVNVGYLYSGNRRRGYVVTLADDTQNRKYIDLLDNYNEELIKQVDEKTKNLVEMHDNLIMSMATMVESRDNSTGGHIRRTSVVVRILIDEISRAGDMQLSKEFCKNIIKAAPMHDLGKIAVDDAVLRKPGRFTDEEYEKMKHHAAEGARVIHEILKNTDDEAFRMLAENVAHYHHERWDGSGYPKGLRGDEIPLEARIMAIADVYDALVSKRVYKDSMSFEQADAIIMEGMGTQFDAALKKYYVSARPRLEEYYAGIEC